MIFGEKYNKALRLIEKAYQENTEKVTTNNITYPKEYLYAIRMVEVLNHFAPEANEEIYLAAWCQHFYRWDIPRNSYPMDRQGYHKWRSYLYTYQADKAGEVLVKSGYNNISISEVKEMIAKKNIKTNDKSQLLEDVICLVFLTYYLNEFIESHKNDEEKLKRIIKSTWLKMSDKGHKAALKINFSDDVKSLILAAVS